MTALGTGALVAFSVSPAAAETAPPTEATPTVSPSPVTPTPTTTPTTEPTTPPSPEPTEEPIPRRLVLGQSVKGRDIVAVRIGDADADKVLLVMGQMHGDEPYGRYVVDRLRTKSAVEGTAIWTIRTMNPDGMRAKTRLNGRSVDLNRNFPGDWLRGTPGSLYYSGPSPASEPETRAFIEFARLVQPDAVVAFHQHFNVIDQGPKKTRKWAKRLGRQFHLRVTRVPCVTKCAGTMTGWFNSNFPGWALTVELPTAISRARQDSMARVLVGLAPDL